MSCHISLFWYHRFTGLIPPSVSILCVLFENHNWLKKSSLKQTNHGLVNLILAITVTHLDTWEARLILWQTTRLGSLGGQHLWKTARRRSGFAMFGGPWWESSPTQLKMTTPSPGLGERRKWIIVLLMPNTLFFPLCGSQVHIVVWGSVSLGTDKPTFAVLTMKWETGNQQCVYLSLAKGSPACSGTKWSHTKQSWWMWLMRCWFWSGFQDLGLL